MTSTAKLYYSAKETGMWELIPNRLFAVDSIEDYLATKTYISKTVQYQKKELELTLKLDMSQAYAEQLNPSYKYLSITDNEVGAKTYYYYVKKVTWRAKECVMFECVMDVINTFKEGKDYAFKDTTKITREHKDRFLLKVTKRYLNFEIAEEGDSYGAPSLYQNVDITKNGEGTVLVSGKLMVIRRVDGDLRLLQIEIPESNHETDSEILFKFSHLEETDYLDFTDEYGNYYRVYIEGLEDGIYFTYDKNVMRNIDYVAEGINPILQCGSAAGEKVERESPLAVDWYLLYRNQDEPSESLTNPVECYLIPSEQVPTTQGYTFNSTLFPASVEAEKYYYYRIQSGDSVTLSNGTTLSKHGAITTYIEVIKDVNDKFVINYIAYQMDGGLYEIVYYETFTGIDYITFSSVPAPYLWDDNQLDPSELDPDWGHEVDEWGPTVTVNYLDGLDKLDKTQSRNIKLIKIPYCPYNFSISGGKINIPSSIFNLVNMANNGGTNMLCLKLKDMNQKLYSSWDSNINPLAVLYVDTYAHFNPTINTIRQPFLDSKLYSSEFYKPTFYYDSFSYVVQLEKFDIQNYDHASFSITFYMTSTINSKFMFEFDSYHPRYAQENYAKYMPVARNNEEVLYNVPYINYVRTGYNYDVKNKNLQQTSAWFTLGGSAVAMGAALIMPSAPLKAAAVIGSLVSFAMSVKSAINTTIQSENNLKSKIEQEKNQASSVAGSDDVDLMSVYAENRLKYLAYEPNPIMKNLLNNLFFYAGYNSGRMGTPNHNTRVNFDYLEADVVIEKLCNINDDCLNELVNAFKNGVTYLHKTARTTKKWDFAQEYENWELSLMEG